MQREKPLESIVKQTKRVGFGVAILYALMLAVYAVLGRFSLAVLLGGMLGGGYGTLNFFLLGMTIQKAAAMKDENMARLKIKSSYSTRMIGMVLLAVLSFAIPFIDGISCLIALLFPRAVILVMQLTGRIKDD